MERQQVLFTIGYESASLADFIETLKIEDIEVVLDIRALPLSRRAGFSKTTLSKALADKGIGYVHLRGLGTPKAGRDAGKAGDIKGLRTIFRNHMKGEEAQRDLALAIEIAKEKSACLLCVEKEPASCHRYIVAPLITAKTGQTIANLKVREGGAGY